ncbi:MAG: EAL domain-containing protein [Chloroflexota bacterium]|nr:EAL domain-containing protein [Chloroflexota bacterium]
MDKSATQTAITAFIREIDSAQAELNVRADVLDGSRIAAMVVGVAIELLAAALSLWFVRRYGISVSNDAQRRARTSSERIEIVASLRTLRAQPTAEGTATIIAAALNRLPGVDVAGVFESTPDGLLALSIVGLAGFPMQSGDLVPAGHAKHLLGRSHAGPWAERWSRPPEANPFDDALAALGIKSRAFAPIQIDGELIGLIGLGTTDADHGRHLIEELPAIGEFAVVAEAILAPALVARRDTAAKRERIAAMIKGAAFRPVFQPIVDLSTESTVGFEALTRFDDDLRPDVVFAAARECGMGMELETVTLEAALRESRDLAAGAWLSLNVSPALLTHGETLARLLAKAPRPIVLEITEHEAIDAYAPLRAAMRVLGAGVRLAVDDAGAGVANFTHLVELQPDFVKIDAGLVRGVDADPRRRAVVVGLIHYAREAGCQVIAEGIETRLERRTVTDLGVSLGQGYLLGSPMPAEAAIAILADDPAKAPVRPPALRLVS